MLRLAKRRRTSSVRRTRKQPGRTRTRRSRRNKKGMGLTHSFTRWTVPPTSVVTTVSSTYAANGIWTVAPGTGVTEASWSCSFALNNIPSVSEFTNLFDLYRVKAVLITLKMLNSPEGNSIPNSSSSNLYANYFPTLWYTVDQDDANTQSIAQLREYARVKHRVLRPNSEIKILVRPNPLQAIYNGVVTTAYGLARRKQWMDLTNDAIPLYGLKMAIDFEGLVTNALNPWQIKFNAKYYFDVQTPR